ncbi:UNVERIFIED_CONTAM: GDP-L-galactose phosphorylase 1 [Sesamum calycinum]|uniref:GDP-D-glucose phosphorylase 1 n=1 Tax=Sesamum calycinum TaxID=2727403 RepID=A0AAW2MN12_9LAMI
MLTIKRVPTVVSNYQESGSSEDLKSRTEGCGRNCLGDCCLPVSKLPLYVFKNAEHERVEKDIHGSCNGGSPQMSSLNNLLLGQWEDRMNRGLFRYDVTSCETKVLQPFDENKFNFTKVGQEEVLFRFEPNKGKTSFYFHSSPVDSEKDSPSVVAINRIDRDSLLLAFQLAKEASDPFFRVGYNSLGAFATINHLHFQCYTEKLARGEVNQELLDTQVNPAAWEISGHMVLKLRKDYDEASEQYAWRLLAEVSLSEERFQDVKRLVCEAANLQPEDEYTSIQQEARYDSTSPQVTTHLHQGCLVLH